MQPIPTNLGWTTRKPHTAGAATGSAFGTQLQTLLQKTQPPSIPGGPASGTVAPLHPGGMNDAAHRLLSLGGRG